MSEDVTPYNVEKASAISVRLPGALRKQLMDTVESHGDSRWTMTDEVVERLQASFDPSKIVMNVLTNFELPRVVRLVPRPNTDADTERLLDVFAGLKVERCILAARRDELNGAVIVLLAEAAGQQLTVIHDHSYINMARRPRMLNVQRLMHGLEALGILEWTEFCPKLIDDTREQTPADAASSIIAAGAQPFDLKAYLKLLAQHDAFQTHEFVRNREGK